MSLKFQGRSKDLGGFEVRRILPYVHQRMVGPFIFLDQMGPAEFQIGKGIDVRPHPHIGLSTLTYLFEGSILHRDSLGSIQEITPGAVNWMTAGSGISHSERSPNENRKSIQKLFGLQFWVALPKEKEETAPSFFHYPQKDIPEFSFSGAQIKLIAGEALGQKSPVKIHSPLFYMDIQLAKGKTIDLPALGEEAAIFVLKGNIAIQNDLAHENDMMIIDRSSLSIRAEQDSHFILLGGKAFPEGRNIWWNFVSSSNEKMDAAKKSWRDRSFPQVPGETEFIPLPEK